MVGVPLKGAELVLAYTELLDLQDAVKRAPTVEEHDSLKKKYDRLAAELKRRG